MPAPDFRRLEITNELMALLDLEEVDTRVMELIKRADRFCNEGNSEQTFQCCREGQRLAQEIGDQFAQGVACFHLGLHYFVFHAEEADRAANLCEQAAQIFHNVLKPRAEGIAWLAVGQITKYACEQGKDRWHRAMAALLKSALIFDLASSNLNEKACDLYREVVDKYGLYHSSPAQSQPESTRQSSQERMGKQSPFPRHFVFETEETPSPSISVPITLKWTMVIAFIIALFIILVFVMAAIGLENSSLYVIGLVLGFVGSLIWTVSVLWVNGHLVCRVPTDAHAVMQYRNGSLSVVKEGIRLFFPTVERVCAFVPTTRLAFQLFPLELKTKALVPLLVRLKASCCIVDEIRLMNSIEATPTNYFLGLPKPLTCKEIETRVKTKLEIQAKDVIRWVVDTLGAPEILEEPGLLKRQVRQDLKSVAMACGVKIEDFDVEFYVR